MEHRVQGLESAVGEHATKLAVLKRDVEDNKQHTDKLYAKFDKIIEVLGDIKAELAGQNAVTGSNKWLVGLVIVGLVGVAFAVIKNGI